MSAFKVLLGSTAAVFAGMMGVTYMDPSYTQRKFDESRCPPLQKGLPPTRRECIAKLNTHSNPERPLDVLVVGGGCVGSGVAVDAVTRGLSVGLVEMGDYAGGTSSRSTKLIHGGIRYLEKAVFQLDSLQLRLVAEALRERTIMMHQAPNLCESLPTLVPCYHAYDIGMFWAGTKLYDFIAACYGGTLKYSDFVWPYETMNLHPKLRKTNNQNRALLGAVRYYDGQFNDARLCFEVAMTAASYGAATVNYTRVNAMERVKNGRGEELVKTTMTDTLTNTPMTVYSKAVVNASGPFAGAVEKLSKSANPKIENVPALGTHIVVDRKYCPKDHEGLVVPSSDGRIIFTIPWLGGCMLGTTDRKAAIESNPKPSKSDVSFLLKNVEPYLGLVPESAVKSVWAGIRPLAKLRGRNDSSTQNMVREHLIVVDPENLMVSVTGGKWTTYRAMAEQTVDEVRDTVLKGRAQFKPCCTTDLVMASARGLDQLPKEAPKGIPADVHRHWIRNYGNRYNELLALAKKDDYALLKRLRDGAPVTEVEVVWSAQQEHCEHAADFLCRRTRMAFVNSADAEASIPRVVELMAGVKNWGRSQVNEERANAYAYLTTAFHGTE